MCIVAFFENSCPRLIMHAQYCSVVRRFIPMHAKIVCDRYNILCCIDVFICNKLLTNAYYEQPNRHHKSRTILQIYHIVMTLWDIDQFADGVAKYNFKYYNRNVLQNHFDWSWIKCKRILFVYSVSLWYTRYIIVHIIVYHIIIDVCDRRTLVAQ